MFMVYLALSPDCSFGNGTKYLFALYVKMKKIKIKKNNKKNKTSIQYIYFIYGTTYNIKYEDLSNVLKI